jgi:hypothetical protein
MKSEKRKMKNEGARLPVQINPAQGAALSVRDEYASLDGQS